MSIESPDNKSMANRPIVFIHDHLMFLCQKKLCETSFYTLRHTDEWPHPPGVDWRRRPPGEPGVVPVIERAAICPSIPTGWQLPQAIRSGQIPERERLPPVNGSVRPHFAIQVSLLETNFAAVHAHTYMIQIPETAGRPYAAKGHAYGVTSPIVICLDQGQIQGYRLKLRG